MRCPYWVIKHSDTAPGGDSVFCKTDGVIGGVAEEPHLHPVDTI